MVCKKCGKRLKKGEDFCKVCGYYNNPEEEAFTDEDDTIELDDDEDLDEYDDDTEIEEYDEEDLDEYNEDELDEYGEDELDKNLSSDLINNTNISDDSKQYDDYSLETKTTKKRKTSNFQDDRLVEAYIGEDYKWVIKRPINIYAMLLSWIYFLYRKMYIIGSAGLIITGIVYKYAINFLPIYIPIVMILSGIIFNPVYKIVIDYRIKRIKKKNYGIDAFTLEEICKKKGGVNVTMALIIFLLFLLIMLRTYYTITYNNENTKYWKENSENKANCISSTKHDYKLLDDYQISAELKGAVCNVRQTNSTKSYDVYLKITVDNKDKYIFFKDEKNTVAIEGIELDLEELQKKNREDTITDEEKKSLNRLLEIKSNYSKYYNESDLEDQLIKTRKNKKEKLNYIFTKDEVLR